MLESSKLDRAKFPCAGLQHKFIMEARSKASVIDIAKVCACSDRTIRTWQNEIFLMTYTAVEKICKTYRMPFPKVARVSRSEQNKLAGRVGGRRTIEKYGKVPANEAFRKEKRQQWWEEKGRYLKNSITSPKRVQFPKRSIMLAEFCGIVLGDGGITDYQVTITLNLKDDAKYAVFVVRLCEKLFGFSPGIYIRKEDNTKTILLSRIEVVRFLTKRMGLIKGNKVKHQISIPHWIMTKKSYQVACLRGLVDTDGSVFTHRYIVNGKQYAYKKLSFTSASEPLKNDVYKILKVLGMKPHLTGKFDVRLDSKVDMRTYFSLVSSSNPKHLKRYEK